MIQTLNLNAPAPPVPMLSYLEADMILLDAYKYLEHRSLRNEDDALDILVQAHEHVSDAVNAALIREKPWWGN